MGGEILVEINRDHQQLDVRSNDEQSRFPPVGSADEVKGTSPEVDGRQAHRIFFD